MDSSDVHRAPGLLNSDSDHMTSTPLTNGRMRRTNGCPWSDADSSGIHSSEQTDSEPETEEGGSLDTRSNGPLLLSRQQLRRLESIMSTASVRSRREPSFDFDADFEGADDEMKDFALQYVQDIILQSQQVVLDEELTEEEDNSSLLDELMDSQQQTDNVTDSESNSIRIETTS